MFLSRDRTSVKLMTHTSEIDAESRLRKIGADFSYQMRSGTKKIGAENQHSRSKNWQQTIKSSNYTKWSNGIDQSISLVAVVVTCIPVQKLVRNRTRIRLAPESGTRKIWYQIGMTHSPDSRSRSHQLYTLTLLWISPGVISNLSGIRPSFRLDLIV